MIRAEYSRSWRDRLRLSLAAVALLVPPPVISPSYLPESFDPVELQQQEDVTIISANVHNRPLIQFFNSNFLEAEPIKIIVDQQPDIACFQEISQINARLLTSHGEVVYAQNNKKPLNESVGVAMVSTRKMDDIETPNLSESLTRPAIVAKVDGVNMACLHLTNGPSKATQELRKLLRLYPDIDLIAGDFNLEPDQIAGLVEEFQIQSPESTTLVRSKKRGAVDRILLKQTSALTLAKWSIKSFSTGSDHRAVKFVGKPSSSSNLLRKDLH